MGETENMQCLVGGETTLVSSRTHILSVALYMLDYLQVTEYLHHHNNCLSSFIKDC